MSDRQVLLLNGACGVGKTTLAEAVSDALNERKIPHAVIDLDALSKVFPRPQDDPYGTTIALRNLTTLMPNFGAHALILARVIETEAELRALEAALGPCQITHILLRANLTTLHSRLARRETGESLDWHCQRATTLDAALLSGPSPDLTLDTTNLTPTQGATVLLTVTDWLAQ
jgi:adenylylsulfate kinase